MFLKSKNNTMQLSIPSSVRPFFRKPIWLLLLAFVGSVFTSPKWGLALPPWLAILFLLAFIRQSGWKRGFLLAWPVLWLAGIIGALDVVPLPTPFVIVYTLIGSLLSLAPYFIDKWLHGRLPDWAGTLVFPTAAVCLDFFTAQGAAGTWGNIAYLQFSNTWLMQLASVTGIWGIGFLIYWFASTANTVFAQMEKQKPFRRVAVPYLAVFLAVMVFGFLRVQFSPSAQQLTVAGITAENIGIFEQVHLAETGEQVNIPPDASQTNPELARVSASMVAFVANSDDAKFKPAFTEIDRIVEELYMQSVAAVEQGAKVIAWTEGIVAVLKHDEDRYINQARQFAKEHQVWLFFPMSAILPGEVQPGTAFMENKVLTISPLGEVVNTYFKSIPVGGVEPCVPGDGIIPVIETEYGPISPVICYDADFPQLLRQVGQQETELLIVPSGDWAAISPVHSYMAAVRAIENGVSMLRPASRGLSVVTDAYGRILAQDDFFSDDDHLLIGSVPMVKIPTIYNRIGNLFVWLCGTGLLLLVLTGLLGNRKVG